MDRGPTNSSHFDDSITKSQHIAGVGAQQGYIDMHVKGSGGSRAPPPPNFQARGGGDATLKKTKLQIDMVFHVQTQHKRVIQNLSN